MGWGGERLELALFTVQVFCVLIIKLCACIALGSIAIKRAGFIKSFRTLQNLHNIVNRISQVVGELNLRRALSTSAGN